MGCGSSTVKTTPSVSPNDPQAQVTPRPKSKKRDAAVEPEPEPEPEVIYQPFTDFPTPKKLADAQLEYNNFQKKGNEEGPNGLPLVSPPPNKKGDIIQVNEMQRIDDYTVSAPKSLAEGTPSKVAEYLTRESSTDLEKIRAIFVWIGTQNLYEYNFTTMPHVESVLSHLLCAKAKRASDTSLFYEMCKASNIPCKILTGYTKGAHYHSGGGKPSYGNKWCAVVVNGAWRLFAPHSSFAACKEEEDFLLISSGPEKQETDLEVPYPKDDFYFLPDPETFIYSHFNEDPNTQMLARPITLDEFQRLAHLTRTFFDLKFCDTSAPESLITADERGEVSLEFTFSHSRCLYLHHKLYKLVGRRKPRDQLKGTNLQEMVRSYQNGAEKKCVLVQLPHYGRYKLVLYASEDNSRSAARLCDYAIDCTVPKPECTVFPECETGEYGLSSEMIALFNIQEANPSEGVIQASEGRAVIILKIADDILVQNNIQLLCECNSVVDKGPPSEVLNNYIRYYFSSGTLTINIRLPEYGDYILRLTAKLGDTKEEKHVANYLIQSKVGCSNLSPYPQSTNGRIGLLHTEADSPIFPITHEVPLLTCSGDSEKLKLGFGLRNNEDLKCKLVMQKSSTTVINFTRFVWAEMVDDDKVKFRMRFPRAGFYDFTIFSKRKNVELFKYIIEVDAPTDDFLPFPNLRADWDQNYQLLQPLEGILVEGRDVRFALDNLEVADVTLMTDSWVGNSFTSVKPGLWECTQLIEVACENVVIKARSTMDDNYGDLLSFEVISEEGLTEKMSEHEKWKAEGELRRRTIEARRLAEETAAKKRAEERQRRIQKARESFLANKDALTEEEQAYRDEEERFYREEEEKEREEIEKMNSPLSDDEKRKIMAEEMSNIEKYKDPESYRRKECYKKMTAQIIRGSMRDYTTVRDKPRLTKAVETFNETQLEEKHHDLTDANQMIDVLRSRDALAGACKRKDVDSIEDEVERIITSKRLLKYLQREVEVARQLRNKLRRQHNTAVNVEMNKKTIAEIRGYGHPPRAIRRVIQAVLLMLGHDEETTSDWKECQHLCNINGRSGFHQQMYSFDPAEMNPEIAARAREILEKEVTFNDVEQIGGGVAAFHIWAMDELDEVDSAGEENGVEVDGRNETKPAKIARQKEIFQAVKAAKEESKRKEKKKKKNGNEERLVNGSVNAG